MDGPVTSFSTRAKRWLAANGRRSRSGWRYLSMNLRWFDRTLCTIAVAAGLCVQPGHAVDLGSTSSASVGSERHLKNIRQLTFGRKNAEAYFSFDGTKLIFQSTNNWMKDSFAAMLKPADEGLGCYQMYVMDLESNTIRLVSTGTGATTCGYFSPAIAACSMPRPMHPGPIVRQSRSGTAPTAGRSTTTTSTRFASTGRKCSA